MSKIKAMLDDELERSSSDLLHIQTCKSTHICESTCNPLQCNLCNETMAKLDKNIRYLLTVL